MGDLKPFARWALIVIFALLGLSFIALTAHAEQPPQVALQYRATLTREAQFIFGLNAPIPALAAQLEQESGWRAGVTAWDNGRGLAQFMDPTARFVSRRYADLGIPDPYNPTWAIRAQVRLNDFNLRRVKGDTTCDRWGAGLKAYNAGLGYVQKAQAASGTPGQWFGATEFIKSGQSAKNFEYSRMYPRWILLRRQNKYADWGLRICGDRT